MSSENQIVKLDIGGTVFKTSKFTLTRFDGMLKVMMETEIPVTKDESGAIFIDRSPKHFELILNFMRDGDVELPDSEKEIKEIQKEADFYMLSALVELCQESFPVLIVSYDQETAFSQTDRDILKFLNKIGNRVKIYHQATDELTLYETSKFWEWTLLFKDYVTKMPVGDKSPTNFIESLEKAIKEHPLLRSILIS